MQIRENRIATTASAKQWTSAIRSGRLPRGAASLAFILQLVLDWQDQGVAAKTVNLKTLEDRKSMSGFGMRVGCQNKVRDTGCDWDKLRLTRMREARCISTIEERGWLAVKVCQS